jgi:hypothetical protein
MAFFGNYSGFLETILIFSGTIVTITSCLCQTQLPDGDGQTEPWL